MSETLTDIYNDISAHDQEYLEKHAEQIKVAEEEDAAGRIMARGFADELHKLAQEPEVKGFADKTKKLTPPGGTVKTKGYQVGGGATGPGPSAVQGRTIKAPKVPTLKGRGSFTPGATVGGGGQIKQPKPAGQ